MFHKLKYHTISKILIKIKYFAFTENNYDVNYILLVKSEFLQISTFFNIRIITVLLCSKIYIEI